LDGLTPEQRRLVLALVDAARSIGKASTVEVHPVEAGAEGHGNDRSAA
jgi:hypothetical protein